MPNSKSLTMYHDVKLVLDAAIAAGGGVYTLPTHGKAVHWRQRAYNYRRLLRESKIASSIIPGLDPTTPYDTIELVITDRDSCDVIIRQIQVKGVLRDAEGKPINVTPSSPAPEPQDELDALALDLINTKGV